MENQTATSIQVDDNGEPQPHQYGITPPEGNNKGWRERFNKFSIVLVGFHFVGSRPLLISGVTFTVTLSLIVYSGYILTLLYMAIPKFAMSNDTQPTHRDGRWPSTAADFHFLSGTLSAILFMVITSLHLSLTNEMYLLLLICPVFSFMATIIIFIHGLKNHDDNLGNTDRASERESITKNTFCFAYVSAWIGLSILPAKIGMDYWKNSGSFTSQYIEIIIVAASLISNIGVFTMALTSTPYLLDYIPMFYYVWGFRISMFGLLELAAMSLVSELLGVGYTIIFLISLIITILIVYLRGYLLTVESTPNTSRKTEKEIHEKLGEIAGVCFFVLITAYFAKYVSTGYTLVFLQKFLSLFMLLLIIFSSIGMAYPFLETNISENVYGHIGNLIDVLAPVLVLGFHVVINIFFGIKGGISSVASPPSA